MEYKYYHNTNTFIKKVINENFPNTIPKEDLDDRPANLLWMIGEMQTFDDYGKASRWIGWMLRDIELLELITNEQSRVLIRSDKE